MFQSDILSLVICLVVGVAFGILIAIFSKGFFITESDRKVASLNEYIAQEKKIADQYRDKHVLLEKTYNQLKKTLDESYRELGKLDSRFYDLLSKAYFHVPKKGFQKASGIVELTEKDKLRLLSYNTKPEEKKLL